MEELFIEIRGIYDGWSVYVDKQGFMYNRWSFAEEPHRHAQVEDWLREYFPARVWETEE